MPGIVIQSNFDLMQSVPIDSRLIATNSTDREAIQYKYTGLKVYQIDNQLTYTYNGSGWIVEERGGIYGGSGSMVGDTFVNFGTVSDSISSTSRYLVWQASTTGTTKAYLYNNFVRHTTTTPTIEWRGLEYRHQFKYLDVNNIERSSSMIAFNPLPGGTDNQPGGLAFWTGYSTNNSLSEKLRITNAGKIGIQTTDPKEYFQIGSASSGSSARPFVIHTGGSSVIGYNWYYTTSDQIFDSTHGSSKLTQLNGDFYLQNRPSGTSNTNFNTTIFTTGTASGRVGIRTTTPTVALDVNGSINSNSNINGLTITGVTISASSRTNSPTYYLSGLQNTYMYTGPFVTGQPTNTFILKVGGTSSFISTGSNNYFYPTSNFSDVNISNDLNVSGDTTIGGNLTVIGTSSITNFEPFTTLVPTEAYRANSPGQFVTTAPISSFTYSFTAYRVGALVNLNIYVELLSSITHTGNDFYGFMFKINSERFKPFSVGYGSGSGGGGVTQDHYGLNLEVFTTDPSSGGATPATGNDFYVRVRTIRTQSAQIGVDFVGSGPLILSSTKFRGTITYKAGDITSSSIPTPPTLPTLPPELS